MIDGSYEQSQEEFNWHNISAPDLSLLSIIRLAFANSENNAGKSIRSIVDESEWPLVRRVVGFSQVRGASVLSR